MRNRSEKHKFSVKERLKTFIHTFRGLKVLFVEEHNARIHLSVSVLVVVFGFVFEISTVEWFVVLILIGSVLAMEAMNTAVENLCDHVTPEWSKTIGKIKDLAAAAVFILAVISVICGLIIFIPKILKFAEVFFN